MKILKWLICSIVLLSALAVSAVYFTLRGSLPTLNGELFTTDISAKATLARDTIGTAIVHADTKHDAAYLLGYAHAQDRLFQMDLMRRQAAGELSELVGTRALELDKKHRIHQFRQRAKATYLKLPIEQRQMLQQYSKGVNKAALEYSVLPFEYLLVSSEFKPWQTEDSLLVIYSMYIDLQLAQTEKDFRFTALKELFGESMYQFFTLPSNFQAAIDYSVIKTGAIEIPHAPALILTNSEGLTTRSTRNTDETLVWYDSVTEPADIGSNNWAVAGKLTQSTSAMLSNDMHLGLRVPAIWYRTQLNYKANNQDIQITGLSLPGTPAIIVGSNGHIAWGFTNANVDNVDWVRLPKNAPVEIISEQIITPTDSITFSFEMSEYGPVRYFKDVRYALKWVAHQDYAVNVNIVDMPKMKTIEEALTLAKSIRIPVQNMVVADSKGSVAWQLTGAISGRTNLIRHAINAKDVSPLWSIAEANPAQNKNPENGRVWSANARVVGIEELKRYGDGGYSLGARQLQIMQQLMAQNHFTEQDFYNMQLDNRALFLMPWHNLLLNALKNSPQKYEQDIQQLNDWQACACKSSVGYTLVRRFRSTIINQLLSPINQTLQQYELSTSYLLTNIEPAIWAIIESEPKDWLPSGKADYQTFLMSAYDTTKSELLNTYSEHKQDIADLTWGKVNSLKVQHPFASSLGIFSGLLNMPEVAAFGDSYMPAVQAASFGASQRLIVRPGNEDKAILTIPGGQSGHFLSPYFRSGFAQYSAQKNTPLLPLDTQHTISFMPAKNELNE